MSQSVRYFDGVTEVLEGDHVTYRSMLLWWKWKPGRVSHVPGVSKFHAEMESNGVTWVGISGADGTFRGVLVDPNKRTLQKTVRFIGRSDGGQFLTPHELPDDEW